jgi:chromosome segregation ATPase
MNLIKLKRNELKCSWSLLDRVNNLSTALEQEIIFFKDSEAKLFQKLKHAKAEKAQMPKDNKALEQQLEEYILEVRSMDTFKANLLNLYKIELKCFLSLSELLLSKYCS